MNEQKEEVMYFIFTHEFYQEERPTIKQSTNAEELLKVIQFSKSDVNLGTFNILAETQLLNVLNDRNEDIYRSELATDADMTILDSRYNLLMNDIAETFSQTARKTLESSL